jgi:hypothetical protein
MRYLFGFFLFIFLTGCGGGSSTTTTEDNSQGFQPSVTVQNVVKNEVEGNILSIDADIIFRENNSYFIDAIFSNIVPSSEECKIDSYTVTPPVLNNNTPGKLHINFDAGCTSINQLKFQADEVAKYVDVDVKAKTGTISVVSVLNLKVGSTEGTVETTNSSGVVKKLLIFPSNISVTQPEQTEEITIYTVDESNRPVSATVKIPQLITDDNKVFGKLNSYSVTTNNQGIAKVIYTAPEDIDDLNGSQDVNFSVDSAQLSKNVTFNFHKTEIEEAKVAKLILSPNSLYITSGLQEQTINIYTLDENNSPLSVKVKMNPILIDENDKIFGFLNTNEVITDENGKAVVTYSAPQNIEDLGGSKEIPFFAKDNNKSVSVSFQKTIPEPVVDKLIAIPSAITITQPSQPVDITLYTLDSDNRPLSEVVTANFLLDENNQTFGELSEYKIETDSKGKGVTTYTAPKDISYLAGKTEYINFYIDKLDKKVSIPVTFKPSSKSVLYKIELIQPNNSYTIDTKGNIGFQIVQEFNPSKVIADKDVHEVNVSIENHLIAFNEEENNFTTSYKETAMKSYNIWTGIHSGIDFVDVNASIFDGEKNVTITAKLKVVVASGPIHSISVNYLSTKYDTATGLYLEKYAIHAVDKYSNPAQEGSRIYFGAVNNKKVYAEQNGTIKVDNDKTKFEAKDIKPNKEIVKRDTLIVLPTEDRTEGPYLGGWIITNIEKDGDDYTFTLNEPYTFDKTDKLNFVIGDDKRFDKCYQTIALMDVDSSDGTYAINSDGVAYATLRYDPYLVGKTVTLYANSVTDERVGVAAKTILRGEGIIVSDNSVLSCTTDSNKECKVTAILEDTLGYSLKDTPLKGTFIIDTTPDDADANCKIKSEDDRSACNGTFNITLESNDKDKKCYVTWTKTIYTEY